jgi:enoyl-CoA hydratase
MINGLCLGGGCEVALACDIRVASDISKFGQPEILLGMIPGSGATQRLPRLIGQGMARELIFTGDIIDANEALRIGLVNRVVPASELRRVTMEMAQKIANRGTVSLKMAKRSLRMSQEIGVSAGLAFEALAETAVFCSPDRKEGVDAFFEKRQPNYHKEKKD